MQKSITKSLNTSEVTETINIRKVKIYMQLKKAKNYKVLPAFDETHDSTTFSRLCMKII